ncbi:Uncharacterised protein [Candidatus Bartonella washoeensis]|uniref:Uncharacterized protein n=1 Tax=Candidatus Bartonella washoeensis Sb944nv TaxID=1094563 RepID=J0YPZ6_9HYPH|nr:hypothetical protein [Bartonella washoeensis]EJF76793.1 hypothetical protein MCQ_01656 [Bartonella washoeensis Sb944nv]SPU27954.1 Uncharacterised protein [Bartonella washoeensis]
MEKRIRARQKAYFKKLYRKIAFVCMLLLCALVFGFAIVKIVSYFSSKKSVMQFMALELNIPVFDHRVYCKEVAASVMPDMKKQVYQHCINLESEAYFAIREMWDTLSDPAKKKCMKMVRPGDGNYFLLRDCILNEKEGKKTKLRNHF